MPVLRDVCVHLTPPCGCPLPDGPGPGRDDWREGSPGRVVREEKDVFLSPISSWCGRVEFQGRGLSPDLDWVLRSAGEGGCDGPTGRERGVGPSRPPRLAR